MRTGLRRGTFVGIGFGPRVGIEVNALYSRFSAASGGAAVRGHSVEFPVLGKFYFADFHLAARPYASWGSRSVTSGSTICARIALETAGSTALEPAVGAVVAGGVAFKTWILKLSPEIRYTRWGGYNFPATFVTNSRD